MNPRFSDHLTLVLTFVLSTFFDFYWNVFILWRVPRCLFFVKLLFISPNGDKNTTVTCDRIKRAFLP